MRVQGGAPTHHRGVGWRAGDPHVGERAEPASGACRQHTALVGGPQAGQLGGRGKGGEGAREVSVKAAVGYGRFGLDALQHMAGEEQETTKERQVQNW